MALALQSAFERGRVAVVNAYCVLKKRPKPSRPERIVHQGQSAGGETVKAAFGVHNSGTAGGGACELNGRFDPFAAAAAKINFL